MIGLGGLLFVVALAAWAICNRLETIAQAIRWSGSLTQTVRVENLPGADDIDEFETAARTLRGRRWNTREADALAELVEIGRELP